MRGRGVTCECSAKSTSRQGRPWLTLSRGFFGQGDMQKEFEEAAFKLNKGEVSDMVVTASGIHLIQRFATNEPPGAVQR